MSCQCEICRAAREGRVPTITFGGVDPSPSEMAKFILESMGRWDEARKDARVPPPPRREARALPPASAGGPEGAARDEAKAETEDEIKARAEKESKMSDEQKKGDRYVELERAGKKITLPEGMSFEDGILWLQRKREEDQRVVTVSEEVSGYPLDAGIAVMRALERSRGFLGLESTKSMFGENPPAMITVETGVEETTQVPWGRVTVPGIEGYLETGLTLRDGRPVLQIGGQVKQKHRSEVASLIAEARQLLKAESIYRGKAIRVRFPQAGEPPNPKLMPRFIDLRRVREDELTFPTAVAEQVRTSLFTPIERTEACRRAGIPLKRGVLLEGPFGVGKTLTAYVTAKKCAENGWTFIYLETVGDLQQAIAFAKEYQPACIFAEDLDRAVSGDRSVSMDAILNTIDGIESKGTEVMVVLTTNDVEAVNRAMLRPGRLDAVISVTPPDAAAAVRLVRTYGRGLIREGEDLAPVGEALAGRIPAVIREVVERAKLQSVACGGEVELLASNLLAAASGMARQLELLDNDADEPMDDVEVFAEAFGSVVGKYVRPAMEDAREAKKNGHNRHLKVFEAADKSDEGRAESDS